MSISEARSTITELRARGKEFKSDPKGFAKEVGTELHSQVSSAFSSSQGAYVYPFAGILYFIKTPALHGPIIGVLAKGAAASAAITIAMFFFTFLPQMAVLSLFATPFLGIPGAIVLVLIESWLIINIIVKTFLIAPLQDDLFDRVLTNNGLSSLVASAPKRSNRVSLAVKRSLDRFSPAAIARYIATFPLTFIPVVGPIVFFVINGRKMGQSFHSRYFELKGWTGERIHAFEEPRKGGYTAFGTVALVMQMIPVVGILFTATSTVGAALWAVEIEKKKEGDAPYQSIAPAAPGAAAIGAIGHISQEL